MSMGGAETTFDPLVLDCRFEFFDAAVESFFLFGGDGAAGDKPTMNSSFNRFSITSEI